MKHSRKPKLTPADVINNKIDFIKNYPQTSYERAKAFNYFPQIVTPPPQNFAIDTTALWDTDNVSGLEKKVCKIGGISNIFRRFLYCAGNATLITTGDTPPNIVSFFQIKTMIRLHLLIMMMKLH